MSLRTILRKWRNRSRPRAGHLVDFYAGSPWK